MNPAIALSGVGKVFIREDGGTVEVLAGLDLAIEAGSFVTLVGRSGSGKSTILNMIAGLTEPSSGTIAFADGNPKRPRLDVGYLTQKETLLPWRDVLANVALPLEVRGVPRADRERRALELIALVGLDGVEHRYPRELSGGMARRASLARMLAADPAILLLDEPFGALDAQLRADLQGELLRLWGGSGKTILFVTHDIDEALTLADRIVVLQWGGRIAIDEAVTFPRPRGAREVRGAPAFAAFYDRLLDAIGADPRAATRVA
jgi:NitT/TauT family transport system ATP-binding protein